MSPIHSELSEADRLAEVEFATRYALNELLPEERDEFEQRYAQDVGFRTRYDAWAQGLSQGAETPKVANATSAKVSYLLSKIRVIPVLVIVIAGLALSVIAAQFARSDIGLQAQLLRTSDDSVFATATLTTSGDAIVIELQTAPQDTTIARQVWVFGPEGAFVSLGVLNVEGGTTLSLPDDRVLDGAVILVTAEPLGGSGTAGPTGDDIAAGAFDTP